MDRRHLPSPRRVEMAGKQFNRWTVLAFAGHRNKKKAVALWRCVCQCGTEGIVEGEKLRSGHSKSCGCLQREVTSRRTVGKGMAAKPGDIGARNALLRQNIEQARRRGLIWTLTATEAMTLYRGNCFYCGAVPAQKNCGSRSVHVLPFIYNGIDRVDNLQGYVSGNVVSCCIQCNRAKAALTPEQFEAWIDRVHYHLHTRVKTLTLVK